MSKLLLIDGSNYLFRAYHALPPLATSAGEPTGAMKGFLGMLANVRKMTKPDFAAVVFDAPGKTFRHDMYAEYKANRPPMPDDLRVQIAPLHNVVRLLGWPLLSVRGIEADDVIGTLAKMGEKAGMDVVVATGDKDLAQLVNDKIVVLNTMNSKYYDREGVIEKYGVPPEKIVDYLALMGDKVDNVPGIQSCGPKTAAKWVNEFGSLDDIVARAGEVGGKIGEKLRAGLEFLPLGRDLVTVKCDAEIPGVETLDALKFAEPDIEALNQFGLRWEMSARSVLRAVPGDLDVRKSSFSGKPAIEAKVSEGATEADTMQASFDFSEFATEAKAAPVKKTVPAAESAQPRREMPTESFAVTDNPDEIPFVRVDSREALERLVAALGVSREEPVGITIIYDGAPRTPDVGGMAFAMSAKEVYVALACEGLTTAALFEAVAPWFASDAPKVFHDAKASLHALRAQKCSVGGIVDDTMLMDYVLEAHLGHALEKLAARMLARRIPLREDVLGKGAKRIGWRDADQEKTAVMLAEEAAAVRSLFGVLRQRLAADESLETIYETIERPLMPVLFRMEAEGVSLDGRKLLDEGEELGARIEELEREAYAAAGREFKLSSPKQLAEVLFAELGCPVIKKTSSGTPSTDEDVLTELALDYPLPKILLTYRRLSKLKSTYLDKLPKMVAESGRIHTTFGQATAVTGRLASSEPNLQNIPARTEEGRRIRDAFLPREGWLIVDADYSQIELRIMAHLSQDKGLLSAFEKGEDVHRSTAAEVFRVALEEVTPDQRRMAKVINFGLIYGMSAFGLAQQLGLDRKVAAAYVDEYFHRFPGVRRYMDETRAKANRDGFVETAFGRRLWLPDIRSARHAVKAGAERAAINAPMQGTAADLIKMAMIAVDDWLGREKLAAKLLLQVHDELVLEVPPEEVEVVKAMLPKLMAEVAFLSVPLIAEVGVGATWGEAH